MTLGGVGSLDHIYIYIYSILFNNVLLIYVGREECKDKLVGNGQRSWRDYSRVKDVEDILNRQDEGGYDGSGCMV